MAFERFVVLRVPFPFTDRLATKNRPALVLSDARTFNAPAGHSVLAHDHLGGQCPVAAGLPD